MRLDEGCLLHRNGRIVVLKDKKGGPSQLRIENKNEPLDVLKVYVVDECLIAAGERCDFLVLPNEKAALFVELKGADVQRGLKQLQVSIEKLSNHVGGRTIYAALVSTKCPLSQSDVAAAQTLLKRKYKCTLRIKNLKYDCVSSDF